MSPAILAVERQDEILVFVNTMGAISIEQRPADGSAPELICIQPGNVNAVIQALRRVKREALGEGRD